MDYLIKHVLFILIENSLSCGTCPKFAESQNITINFSMAVI